MIGGRDTWELLTSKVKSNLRCFVGSFPSGEPDEPYANEPDPNDNFTVN